MRRSLLWSLLVLGLLLLAVLAQADRASRFQPALAALVPEPARGFAARQLAARAVAAGEAEAALQHIRVLIAARPLPAEHLRLLAQAQFLARNAPAALAALEAASRRGWREPLTQLAAAEAALLAGDPEAAALRIAALHATGQATGALAAESGALLARLLATPAGRAAFARLMAGPGRWPINTVLLAAGSVPADHWADTLARAEAAGASFPCDRLSALARRYAAQGEPQAAAQVLPARCHPPRA